MADIKAASAYHSRHLGAAFLAIASGGSDVIAFLLLGQVFASAMTGNTALLGIAISEGDLLAASKPFAPLLGFVVGAAFASAIYSPDVPAARQPVILRTLLLFEIACLGAFAIVWQLADDPTQGVILYVLILLCSIGMGIQGIAAKSVNVPGISTIVFTSTLAGIVQSVTDILLRRKDTLEFRSATKVQIAIFGTYAAGAVLAGVLEWNGFAWLAFMPVAAVIFALGCFELRRGRPAEP
jgi:uncharacterized membrane protein YoaK (UPF0700 family)